MNARDKKLAEAAEAYADRDFKGEINWSEAYESKLIDLIRADAMEAATRAANESWTLLAKALVLAEREACAKVCEDMQSGWPSDDHLACAAGIRARGNT